ncbi:glycosyltransferase family 4 protein [Geomobilimonas luticola]|uniref:Glycosyltransferase family 4 protein n=1 Tax=Geomobilimonas luticola TaxID=1114878 RepID=A0ABS5SET5_9BACT|nr:glycosyltransferase family 1 protein [Geomobilimonas luticola]MBT0653024.1 glycosyltransferase family 4 protein [Geomobilimonas luticola]
MSGKKDQMKSGLTIALLGRYFGWGGGIELLRVIGHALALKANSEPLKLYLLLPVENRLECREDVLELGARLVSNLAKLKLISHKERPLYDPNMLDSFTHIDGHITIVFHNDTNGGLIRCLQKIDADVVLPVLGCLDDSFPLPWLGYIYDFQHKYYPQFFDADTCRGRDLLFGNTLKLAKAVIVNSQSVKNDIATFSPDHSCRVFAMPFAATPAHSWFDAPEDGLHVKYNLPDNYFVISNQFWIHKSHGTAFEALAMLRQAPEVHIVCTGLMEDHRFPHYFAELQAKIEAWGVADRIHFLGHIPKLDQIQIMKMAIGVIQPTLFEGGPGGGSIYDAVALGVPAIVSDIMINREIMEESVRFFTVGSAEDLATKMCELILNRPGRPSTETLIARGRERAELLGDTLLKAIEYVMLQSSRRR